MFDNLEENSGLKFNVDIAFQQSVHRIMFSASINSVIQNQEVRYRLLKSARILLCGAMKPELSIKLKTMQDGVEKKLETFQKLCHIFSMDYNTEMGQYTQTPGNGIKKQLSPSQEYYDSLKNLDKALDDWEEELRQGMKVVGMTFVKDKTAMEAVSDL